MRRGLVTGATVCALLWAVCGVSVLAIAYHEHHHHHAEAHNHDDAFDLVLHCHDNGAPHHDHELTAALTGIRAKTSVDGQVVVDLPNDLDDMVLESFNALICNQSEVRDLGPHSYLLHCVSLT